MPEFPCPEPVLLVTRVGGGAVDVVSEDRQTATVEVAPYDDSDASREAATNTRVEMRQGRLLVEAPDASGWLFRRNPRIRVDIRLPLDCPVQLKVASADVSCHGRYATAAINSASGDVFVEAVTGDVTANTASGDVRIGDVGGRLDVKAASGDVSVQQATGPVTVHSASGDVEVDEAGEGVRATTASGDVRIGAARKGTLSLRSASGDISVGVVAGTGVWLDLVTMSGSTRSDLAVGGTQEPRSGAPELTVQVRTASGDIEIRRVVEPATA